MENTMFRDVIVEHNGKKQLVRVEGDADTTEISDIVARRLAYGYVVGDNHNDAVIEQYTAVIERYTEIAPAPHCIIGMDGKRKMGYR